MDEMVRFGPAVLSVLALVLAWRAARRAARERAHRIEFERAFLATHAAARAAPASAPEAAGGAHGVSPLPSSFEERLGALDAHLSRLSDVVADLGRPSPDDVAPMRPPARTPVEPAPSLPSAASLRAGWRMFP